MMHACCNDGMMHGGMAMKMFIDVFYLPDMDEHEPFRCFTWQASSIARITQHTDIAALAAWCKQQALAVRVYDPHIHTALRSYGIEALSAREEMPLLQRQLGER
jgi:hypothetical protein